MGIEDRDYYRERRPGISLRMPAYVVTTLVIINVLIYIAGELSTPHGWVDQRGHTGLTHITDLFALRVGDLGRPWYWWRFLTYGFMHARSPIHVAGNMLGLWFLGRAVEERYGRKEFLRIYLVLLVVAGVAWAIVTKLQGAPEWTVAVGASGAVVGVVILYALNFPRRTLLVMFVLPVPAWLVGVFIVANDLLGSMHGDAQIAYSAHLAGAAFAFLYFQFGWRFERWIPGGLSLSRLKPRPKLRVHDPDREIRREEELSNEVDRILEKIHREGEQSLTRKERRTLESASRKYQERRRDGPGS